MPEKTNVAAFRNYLCNNAMQKLQDAVALKAEVAKCEEFYPDFREPIQFNEKSILNKEKIINCQASAYKLAFLSEEIERTTPSARHEETEDRGRESSGSHVERARRERSWRLPGQ